MRGKISATACSSDGTSHLEQRGRLLPVLLPPRTSPVIDSGDTPRVNPAWPGAVQRRKLRFTMRSWFFFLVSLLALAPLFGALGCHESAETASPPLADAGPDTNVAEAASVEAGDASVPDDPAEDALPGDASHDANPAVTRLVSFDADAVDLLGMTSDYQTVYVVGSTLYAVTLDGTVTTIVDDPLFATFNYSSGFQRTAFWWLSAQGTTLNVWTAASGVATFASSTANSDQFPVVNASSTQIAYVGPAPDGSVWGLPTVANLDGSGTPVTLPVAAQTAACGVQSLAFGSNGALGVNFASDCGMLNVFSGPSFASVLAVPLGQMAPSGAYAWVTASTDGAKLVQTSDGGTVYTDPSAGQVIFDSSGTYLLTIGNDGSAKRVTLAYPPTSISVLPSGSIVTDPNTTSRAVYRVSSDDGALLYGCTQATTGYCLVATDGAGVPVALDTPQLGQFWFTTDSSTLLWGDAQELGTLYAIPVAGGSIATVAQNLVNVVPVRGTRVVVETEDGGLSVSAGDHPAASLMDVTGQTPTTLLSPAILTGGLAPSPDGAFVAVTSLSPVALYAVGPL